MQNLQGLIKVSRIKYLILALHVVLATITALINSQTTERTITMNLVELIIVISASLMIPSPVIIYSLHFYYKFRFLYILLLYFKA